MVAKKDLTVMLVASDIHYGKKTASYDTAICLSRLNKISTKLKKIHSRQKSIWNINGFVLALLGDIVDGSLIFSGQSYEQDQPSVMQQAKGIIVGLKELVEEQGKIWGDIRVECVAGNHGRSQGMAMQDNFDLLTYIMLREACSSSHVFFDDTEPFMRKFNVYDWEILQHHGSDIRSYQGIPTYGLHRRASLWNSTRSFGGFNAAIFGHFHTSLVFPMNDVTLIGTGTLVTGDDWALRVCGMESRATWWIVGISRKRLIEFLIPLDCDEE